MVTLLRVRLLACFYAWSDHFSSHDVSLTGHFREFEMVYKISPVTGLEWPKGFQEVKFPRFRDNDTGWW